MSNLGNSVGRETIGARTHFATTNYFNSRVFEKSIDMF